MDCANIIIENDFLYTVVIRRKSFRPLICYGVCQSLKIFIAILLYTSCPISNWSAKWLYFHHMRANSRRFDPAVSVLGLELWCISCSIALFKGILLILIHYVIFIAFIVLKCIFNLLNGRKTSLLLFQGVIWFRFLNSEGIKFFT